MVEGHSMILTIFVNPFVFLSMVFMLCFNEISFFFLFFFELQLKCTIAKYYITRMWTNLGGVPGPIRGVAVVNVVHAGLQVGERAR